MGTVLKHPGLLSLIAVIYLTLKNSAPILGTLGANPLPCCPDDGSWSGGSGTGFLFWGAVLLRSGAASA